MVMTSFPASSAAMLCKRYTPTNEPTRIARIRELRGAGVTYRAIGDALGITRQRVRQIAKQFDILGVTKTTASSARDERYLCLYGHDWAAHSYLRHMGKEMMAGGATYEKTPIGAFCRQRQSAKNRGIEWSLTLADWWSVWQESGKWPERGRGHGHYVMSRYGDEGMYTLENVFIQLADCNGIDAPLRDRLQLDSARKAGVARHAARLELTLPMGVQRAPGYTGRLGGRPYYAYRTLGGVQKFLGAFTTVEEAEAAHIAAGNKA